MRRQSRPLPETIALARARALPDADPSPDALIARGFARRLFNALRARVGDELLALFDDRQAMLVADPTYDAADRLYRRLGIYVEPCRRILPSQPVTYLAVWPGGESRNLDEAELLALAGMSVAEPA